eukprot:CAMPEP_0174962058 /NCGR_PEP_ID=MMETSP0004_2-20121128/4577_1 /TAXON_ID=420556 /ORGANISM="Ochromonas sp., Strain CCMP1393" /LENGTH=278 /DNA_ID=CAMNT_0016210557 /DNA_START=198 /DNA_END=1034 /DNA_ORIENTATION=+
MTSQIAPEKLNVTSNGSNNWELEGPELKKFHNRMRHIFDKVDTQEIKDAIVKYTETICLMDALNPGMGSARKDWALAMALSPEWYSDHLETRLQNSMLVSALLLTVTAEIFISPPMDNNESLSFRALIYLCGLSNMLFILSIVAGIFFIENAMSRTYGQSERFVLIIRYFAIKSASQVFAAIGSALFPIVLAIPMWDFFLLVDANALAAITILYVLVAIAIMAVTSMDGSKEQGSRVWKFQTLIDPTSCLLKSEYYPPDADMQLEDFREMYATTTNAN